MLFQAAARGFLVTVMRTSAVVPPLLLGLNDDLAIGVIRSMVDMGVLPASSIDFHASLMYCQVVARFLHGELQ